MWCSAVGCIVTFTLSLLVVPLLAVAQPVGKVRRIGMLIPGSSSDFAPRIEAFRQGLRDLGYVEGRTITIESCCVSQHVSFQRDPDCSARFRAAAAILRGAESRRVRPGLCRDDARAR